MQYVKNKYNLNVSSNVMSKVKIILEGYLCERCEHKWVSRLKKEPIVCPKCHSPYWNKKPKDKNKK